jgi:hypothetical protein
MLLLLDRVTSGNGLSVLDFCYFSWVSSSMREVLSRFVQWSRHIRQRFVVLDSCNLFCRNLSMIAKRGRFLLDHVIVIRLIIVLTSFMYLFYLQVSVWDVSFLLLNLVAFSSGYIVWTAITCLLL